MKLALPLKFVLLPPLLMFVVVSITCDDEPPTTVCESGDSQQCTCPDGRASEASCLVDGTGWTECRCPESDGDADSDVDADGDTDADGDADGDGDTDADGDADIDADSDGAADADLDPDRRHQDIEHLEDGALLGALHGRVVDHTSLGYDEARLAIFTDIDVHSGVIECVYTGQTVAQDGTYTPGNFNTEHSWPRGDGADSEPAESDMHHLFPTDSNANSRRGSHPFGDTSCTAGGCEWSSGGSELGTVVDGAALVFEVRLQTRGDIARAHFYFSVRYEMDIPDSEEAFLRAWHAQDPPSTVELDRNDAIEEYQSNRNPFVDRPDFVGRVTDF